jgi:hypothetical protein
VVAGDFAGLSGQRRADGLARALQRLSRQAAAREIILEPLDPFLLAVHEPDVVAQEEVEYLRAGARQLQIDGVELKQEVVAEGPYQREVSVLHRAELVDEGAQDGERRGLLAPQLFGEKLGKRLQPSNQSPASRFQRLPMGVLRQ